MSSITRHSIPRIARAALIFVAGAALVLGWGYWHALQHAHVDVQVRDYALRTGNQAFGAPHDVALTFRNGRGDLLAHATSIESQGYILAAHPDAVVGNCQHRSTQPNYSDCYGVYSAWSARWAPHVQRADIRVGACTLRNVPVAVYESNNEWPVWWVPLPHVGGAPYRHFTLSIAVNSSSCVVVEPLAHRQK